jgi:short-subunit dehydrogenase
MCQLVLPGMRRQRYGRIVNLSSMGGRLTFPGGGFYHGTKYAVEAISDALRFEVKGFGIDVILIEPGLIKTEFGDTVAKEMGEADGDYAEFNRAVSEATVGAYEGPMMRLGGGPDTVARKIEKALSARRPKARYPVTASARLALMQKALLPDRGWDIAVGTQFPQPGKG